MNRAHHEAASRFLKNLEGLKGVPKIPDGQSVATTGNSRGQRRSQQGPAQPAPLPAQPAPAAQAVVVTPAPPAPAAGGTPPPGGNNPTGGSGGGGGHGGAGDNTPAPAPEPKGWEKFKTDQPGLARLLGLIIVVAVVLLSWVALGRIQVWMYNDMNSVPARPAAPAQVPHEPPAALAPVPSQRSCSSPEDGDTSPRQPLVLGQGECVSLPASRMAQCVWIRASSTPVEVTGVERMASYRPVQKADGTDGLQGLGLVRQNYPSFVATYLGEAICVTQVNGQALSIRF